MPLYHVESHGESHGVLKITRTGFAGELSMATHHHHHNGTTEHSHTGDADGFITIYIIYMIFCSVITTASIITAIVRARPRAAPHPCLAGVRQREATRRESEAGKQGRRGERGRGHWTGSN